MKKTNTVLFAIYLFIVVYFAVFNWEIFIILLNINLGFTVLNIPLIIIIFILGLIFMLIQLGFINIMNLKNERQLIDKQNEIARFKAMQYDEQATEIQQIIFNLNELNARLDQFTSKMDFNSKEGTKDLDVEKYKKTDD